MQKIRDILLMQKRELEDCYSKRYVKRDIRLLNLDNDLIKVIIGPRRAGKSFFAIHELKKKKISYVNFDDENLMEIEDYDKIIESLKSIYDNPQFFFF